jgi:hypothetical protein
VGHSMQSVSALPPLVLRYLPARQAWHTDAVLAPSTDEYLPSPHPTQSEMSSLPDDVRYVPAGHKAHVDSSSAPSDAEYLPAGHSLHVSVPGELLYVPTPQAWHGPPSAPVYPALHRQVVLPAVLPEYTGHVMHAVDAGAALYVSASHSMHSLDPDPSLYLPAKQLVQGPPSSPL